ncbi:MAG: hypothetical protein KIT36_04370 [Alphaproteobacteria bacterium]|nr:hypothetical protein [Alphaproteobacteria bacterium]
MKQDRDLCRRSRDRCPPRAGPWLAILALCIQFIAGFGHFHPEDFQGPAGASTDRMLAIAGTSASPVGPHDNAPTLPTHDDCAICVALHMASAAALPLIPALVVPASSTLSVVPISTGLRVAWPAHFLFDTRGPPRT